MKSAKPTFFEFYESFYESRWAGLYNSLKKENSQVLRPCFGDNKLSINEVFELSTYSSEKKASSIEANSYIMDPASIIAAYCLEINPQDFVLDMCASPGGKSLILLEQLSQDGTLWANEISSARREKLKSVIKKHVPKDNQNSVFIKGLDGAKYGIKYPEHFDKILVDAPCSGERHLIHSPKELEKWSPKRTKRLAATQYSLLCSALLACKENGQIVYSTCSISPYENDAVIEKLINKKSEMFELDLPLINHKNIEKTKYGYQLLPDKSDYGPLYFTRLKKKNT